MMRRMPYAIIRVAKLKTVGNIAASANHAFRESSTPNADPKRLSQNQLAGATTTGELLASVKSKLPEKRRKDAVLALEYFIGASPEAFAKDWQNTKSYKKDYFNDALDWLKKRHGEENLVAAQIHLDEQTPHMSVYIVPRTAEGKLSAKQFTGGRAVLSKMQSDFAREVGAKHKLERGIEGSKATHTTRKQYYAALSTNRGLEPPQPPKKTFLPKLAELNEYRSDLIEFGRVASKATALAMLDKREKDALTKQVAKIATLESENSRLRTSEIELINMLKQQNEESKKRDETINEQSRTVLNLKLQLQMSEHSVKEKTAEIEALKRPVQAPVKASTNDFRP